MDIIFTTLELGKEEILLLDVVKSLEKQVRLADSVFLLYEDGKLAKIVNSTSKVCLFCARHHVKKVQKEICCE